jgi:hypothetical protein
VPIPIQVAPAWVDTLTDGQHLREVDPLDLRVACCGRAHPERCSESRSRFAASRQANETTIRESKIAVPTQDSRAVAQRSSFPDK